MEREPEIHLRDWPRARECDTSRLEMERGWFESGEVRGQVSNVDPGGRYLLGVVQNGENAGIYEVSISDRKCIPLLPGVVTFNATFARDGKSFLYAVASRGDVTIYRQLWKNGNNIGAPQVALMVPFVFPLGYARGNAYDFSRDLSTIVYVRPGGHADLYLRSQK